MDTPLLSVIVPAYQGEILLPVTLGALAASDFPRDRWELIVVDDVSTDATASVARRWADRVVSLEGQPHGPAFARNRGVEASQGTWIVFIDADVKVHTDTLSCFAAAIEAEPGIVAIFGAYDDDPTSPDFLSQYRNLLHRYVHNTSVGEADTFWAGCGAVRRDAYAAIGGFDEARYPRPQIEDIDLGYRLRERGGRIVLRAELQGAHLKRWTLVKAVRADLFDRAIPWVRLLLERGGLITARSLNLRRGERSKAALVGLSGLLLTIAAIWQHAEPALAALILLFVVVLSNLPLFTWFAFRRGPLFAVAVVPMNVLYYVISAVAVGVAFVQHLALRRSNSARLSPQTR